MPTSINKSKAAHRHHHHHHHHHPGGGGSFQDRHDDKNGDKQRRPERSASFHGRATNASPDSRQIRRPKTQPDLLAGRRSGRGGASPEAASPKREESAVPRKALVNVTVQRSLGPLQVMASTEWTVAELVAAAVRLYIKEGRRPPLPTTDPSSFSLHYSQFSLDCLDPGQKLIKLGSRNFFLCPKPVAPASAASASSLAASSCSKQLVQRAFIISIPWLKFMDFLL